jgi:putative membrane protein
VQRIVLSLSSLSLLLFAACGNDSGGSSNDAGNRLSDQEIAATLKASNDGEIQTSQLADGRAQSADVQSFAQDMISMHGQLNQQQQTLLSQIGITPAPGATTVQVTTAAQQLAAQLTPLSGSAFDKAYIDGQVQLHQSTLNLIDQQFLPDVQNAQLKDAIQNTVRPMVQQHLDRAKSLQAALGGDAGTDAGM